MGFAKAFVIFDELGDQHEELIDQIVKEVWNIGKVNAEFRKRYQNLVYTKHHPYR